MCRYAFKEYKSHFACFGCRKAFKKMAMRDFYARKGMAQVYHRLTTHGSKAEMASYVQNYGTDYAGLAQAYAEEVRTCPECGNPMAAMGMDFKAPPQSDLQAWAIIREIRQHGFDFRSCGCGPGYKPPRKFEVAEFLKPRPWRMSAGEKLLVVIAERRK